MQTRRLTQINSASRPATSTDEAYYPAGTAKGTWTGISGTGKYANPKSGGWTQIRWATYGKPEGNV